MTGKTKQLLVLDRAMIGFLLLAASIGGSWATLQLGMKANATSIANVKVDFKAADDAMSDANNTRFERIEATEEGLISDMTSQAILLERIITTTEFIQRDVSKLVDQQGD